MIKQLVENRAFNSWRLFGLVVLPMSVCMVIAMASTDLSRAEGVSSMIQYSVRWAVPWIFLAFSASSVQVLFPGLASRWLLRNRKIFGLCFAAGMAWQLSFIVWLVTVHSEYYSEEVYVLRDVIEGLLGYLFLAAMTVTSFKTGRRLVTSRQWKLLHKTGIYFLWAYAFSVYWYELFYYDQPDPIDYLYYAAGLFAWLLRVAAWSRKRRQAQEKAAAEHVVPRTTRWPGLTLVGIGLVCAIAGSAWTAAAHQHLYDIPLLSMLDLYLPYWPFIPFLPLFVILPGALLVSNSR
jgi:hypothetical protein